MRLQRVRAGGSRIEMQIVKWTAEGMVKKNIFSIHDVWHTLVAGNMSVFR